MNIANAIKALFEKTENALSSGDLQERNWTSLRWIALIAFVGLIVWNVSSKVLDPVALNYIFKGFVVWMACRTVTSTAMILSNAWVRTAMAKQFDSDNTITPGEADVLKSDSGAATPTAQKTP